MTIQEARRAAFIAAFTKKFGFGRMTASSNAEAQQMLEAAEWAWNAALDSAVVELPGRIRDKVGVFYDRESAQYDEGLDVAQESIEAAGIRVEVKS